MKHIALGSSWNQRRRAATTPSAQCSKGATRKATRWMKLLANVKEAIEVYLESLRDHGEAVPVEDILIRPVEVAV